MFSLQVGMLDGTVPSGRLFEYTEEAIKSRFTSNLAALLELPVLSMPELGEHDQEPLARVGKAISLKPIGRAHTFTFVPNPTLGEFPLDAIAELAPKLGMESWELQRTHWAVKDVDLYEVLLEYRNLQTREKSARPLTPGAVQFPVSTPRDPTLVAVMMPFDKGFDVVYETIEKAATDAGLRCVRADDIWEDDHLMADVLSLIWRARIVVADLSGKNPNVFYETGLAHALPRRTVLLTQDPRDVPFDLKSLRYLEYGVGTTERATLRKRLSERLATLASLPPD